MKTKHLAISLFLSATSFSMIGQPAYKSLSWFESYIVTPNPPPLDYSECKSKYEKDYKVIVWPEKLSKVNAYSVAALAKLGYEFIAKTEEDENHEASIYRNCSKNIIIEVSIWYELRLSIAMQWYSPAIRRTTPTLRYCQ